MGHNRQWQIQAKHREKQHVRTLICTPDSSKIRIHVTHEMSKNIG